MKIGKIITYSRNERHATQRNDSSVEYDELFDSEFLKLQTSTSITDLYAKTIESCKKSFSMGNQQEREKLQSTNQIINETGEWETIGYETRSRSQLFTTKVFAESATKIQPRKTTSRASPKPKGLSLRYDFSQAKVGLQKRWSQNRKVVRDGGDSKLGDGQKKTKLAESTRTLKKIYHDKQNNNTSEEKRNSTVCDGGVALSSHPIHGFSPIKNPGAKRRPMKILRLTPDSLARIKTPEITSQRKVQKWLKTTKQLDPESITMHFDEAVEEIQLNNQLEPKKPSGKEGEQEAESQSSCEAELSPIPSVFNNMDFASDIDLEIPTVTCQQHQKPKQRVLTKQQRKTSSSSNSALQKKSKRRRKRICMPKGKIGSPLPKMRKSKSKSKVAGKAMKIKILKPVEPQVKLNTEGDLTFRKDSFLKYNLRSKKTIVSSNRTAQTLLRTPNKLKETAVTAPKDGPLENEKNLSEIDASGIIDDQNNTANFESGVKQSALAVKGQSLRISTEFGMQEVKTKDVNLYERDKEEFCNHNDTNIIMTLKLGSQEEEEEEAKQRYVKKVENQTKKFPFQLIDVSGDTPPNLANVNESNPSKRKLSFAPKQLLTDITEAGDVIREDRYEKNRISFLEEEIEEEEEEEEEEAPTCCLHETTIISTKHYSLATDDSSIVEREESDLSSEALSCCLHETIFLDGKSASGYSVSRYSSPANSDKSSVSDIDILQTLV